MRGDEARRILSKLSCATETECHGASQRTAMRVAPAADEEEVAEPGDAPVVFDEAGNEEFLAESRLARARKALSKTEQGRKGRVALSCTL